MAGTILKRLGCCVPPYLVSMNSGLDGRNNPSIRNTISGRTGRVSMKSGLDGRNNWEATFSRVSPESRLNEVRPRWPEQYPALAVGDILRDTVSMKSGLEDRNNASSRDYLLFAFRVSMKSGLEDRNNRCEAQNSAACHRVSMKSGLEDRNNAAHPRPRRRHHPSVSMKSGLEDRNNQNLEEILDDQLDDT